MDKKELLKLYSLPLDELVEISAKVTKENFNDEVEFCSIISAKTGKCKKIANTVRKARKAKQKSMRIRFYPSKKLNKPPLTLKITAQQGFVS